MTRRVSTALVAMALGLVALTQPVLAQGAPLDAGEITIVDERGKPLSGGGATTKFTFRIPAEDAYCPGDSQNGNYRLNSFMVPIDVAAEDVTYDGLGPKPQHYESYENFRMPLYDQFTADYTSALTAEADELGGPGRIVDIPTLSFGVYRKGELPTGRYRVGLVCTHINDIEKYWDTEITVTADDDDAVAGIAWRVAGATGPVEDESGIGSGVIGGVAGALAAGAIALLVRRRQRAHSTTG